MLCENPATAFQSPALVQWQVDKSQKDDKRRSVSIPPRHPCFPLNIPRRRFIVRHIEIKLHVGKLLEHCSCPLLFVFRVASSSSSWTRRSAGGRASASTSASGAHARSAGGRASASTSTKGANARSAGARASASTSASGVDASPCRCTRVCQSTSTRALPSTCPWQEFWRCPLIMRSFESKI